MEEEEPPILEPTEDVVGDRSGKKLLYTRKDGMLDSRASPPSVELLEEAVLLHEHHS